MWDISPTHRTGAPLRKRVAKMQAESPLPIWESNQIPKVRNDNRLKNTVSETRSERKVKKTKVVRLDLLVPKHPSDIFFDRFCQISIFGPRLQSFLPRKSPGNKKSEFEKWSYELTKKTKVSANNFLIPKLVSLFS